MRLLRVLPGLAVAAVDCLEPTEIRLEITTDADCKDIHGVEIAVGVLGDALEHAPANTRTAQCVNGRIGSLVVVPSNKVSSDPIGVRVTAGFGAGHAVETCAAPFGKGCIVARRELRYVRHTPLTLPIVLEAACDGIPCEASYTCRAGACVPAMPPQCGTPGCDVTVPQWTDCGDTSGAERGAPWPMTDGCPTHIRRSPYAIASAPKPKWRLMQSFNQPILSLPAVSANGSLVFGTETGELDAYEVKTGMLRMSRSVSPMNSLFGNVGLLANGSLVVTGAAGIYGVPTDLSSGPGWTHPPLGTDVVVGPGPITYTVFSGSRTLLLGFDTQGNTPISVDLAPSGFVRPSPTIGIDGTIYVAIQDGAVYAIDPTPPGAMKWRTQVGVCDGNAAACTLPVVATKDRLFVTSYQTINPPNLELDALGTNGGKLWARPGAASSCLPIVGVDGTVYGTFGNEAHALDPATGTTKWSFDFGAEPRSCILDGTGALLAIAGGRLVAVDTNTHSKRWDVDALLGTEMVLGGDGTVFLVTSDNTMVALGYP